MRQRHLLPVLMLLSVLLAGCASQQRHLRASDEDLQAHQQRVEFLNQQYGRLGWPGWLEAVPVIHQSVERHINVSDGNGHTIGLQGDWVGLKAVWPVCFTTDQKVSGASRNIGTQDPHSFIYTDNVEAFTGPATVYGDCRDVAELHP